MITLNYLITSLIIVLIPGAGVIYTVSVGLMQGKRATLYAALGCTIGIVPHLLASVFGLAALMHTSAVAFETLKMAGAAYLLYLAWSTWRAKGMFEFQGAEEAAPSQPHQLVSAWRIISKAQAMNILNPKLSIFFLAFLPQFVSPHATTPLRDMMVLSSVFMLMTFIVFWAYGLLAYGFRKHVLSSPKVQTALQRSFAAAFAALGLNLAFSSR